MDFVLSTILNLGYRPPPNGNQEGADPILILTNEGESAYTDRAEEGKIEYPPVGVDIRLFRAHLYLSLFSLIRIDAFGL